jgi:hypothetical protein
MSKAEGQPDIPVSVYGKNPPRAAEFGKGASTLSEIEQATDARCKLSESRPSRLAARPSRGVTLVAGERDVQIGKGLPVTHCCHHFFQYGSIYPHSTKTPFMFRPSWQPTKHKT